MSGRFGSARLSSRIASVATAAVLAVLGQGCAIVGRTQVDIGRIEDTSGLGGPYYVVDATDLYHASRKARLNETLHDACQKRYPSLFSTKRTAVPLLVSRQSNTSKSNSGFSFSYILSAYSMFLLPPLPQTAIINDRVHISVNDNKKESESFTSRETCFMHVLTTYPFDSILFPRSKGWGKETDDQAAPNIRINETRLAAFADAIVKGLSDMDEADRTALSENAEAWARYYEVRPFVVGRDLIPQDGKTIHEIKVERPSATARIPILKDFSYDRGRRIGSMKCDFKGCDPMFAQKWAFYRILPEQLRVSEPLPGERAILIRKETLTEDGSYLLSFSVVE